jgi:phage baseplate assembly protein W
MATSINTNLFSANWAYDIHRNVLTKGEAIDTDVIDQSIASILGTAFGERLFNPFFGSILPYTLFETINKTTGEQLLDKVVNAIKQWEDRITVIEDKVKLKILTDENSIIIEIPYIVNQNGKSSTFKKKVIY